MSILPTEIMLEISKYISDDKKFSNYSMASRSSKAILDELSVKKGFEDYKNEKLFLAKKCNDCYKYLPYWINFFGRKKFVCDRCYIGYNTICVDDILIHVDLNEYFTARVNP